MTLNRLVINPTYTDAFFCITYDNHKGWYPVLTLSWNGETYSPLNEILHRTDVDPTAATHNFMDAFKSDRCFRIPMKLSYSTPQGNQAPQTMMLTIRQITIKASDAPTQEYCAQSLKTAEQQYQDINFMCEIEYQPGGFSFGIEVLRIPDVMTESDVIRFANVGFTSVVEGPWTCKVDKP